MEHVDCEPWDQVVTAWKQTHELRKANLAAKKQEEVKHRAKKLKKNEEPEPLLTVQEFLNEWINYKSKKGPELIALDFKVQFPAALEFSAQKVSDLVNHLLTLRSQRKIKSYQDKVNKLTNEINQTDDENFKFAARIQMLPYLALARGRLSAAIKINVTICRESMMVIVKVMQ